MKLPLLLTLTTLLLSNPSLTALVPILGPPPPKPTLPPSKYFHEPGESSILGHYDMRYYRGHPVSYDEKADTLHHLIRAYLTVFRTLNIETWIAHGTLLGWWWNARILPWDWDLDVQVSAATLDHLGQNFNMTMHNYTSVSPNGTTIFREYLLDINPHHIERGRGDGQNVIDGRFIDVRNGLFIDITGLSETNPGKMPGLWFCKNLHRYRTREIYPLRQTEFEGVEALVPYSFDRILMAEYSARALTKTFHEGHRWNPEQKEWVKQKYTTNRPKYGPQARDESTTPNVMPHVPRSIQAKTKPRAGLRNLMRLFWGD